MSLCNILGHTLKIDLIWFMQRIRVRLDWKVVFFTFPPSHRILERRSVHLCTSGDYAVRHVAALLDSWRIHMFPGSRFSLGDKSRVLLMMHFQCCHSGLFWGSCCCEWVGPVRRQPGRKKERGDGKNIIPERVKHDSESEFRKSVQLSTPAGAPLLC